MKVPVRRIFTFLGFVVLLLSLIVPVEADRHLDPRASYPFMKVIGGQTIESPFTAPAPGKSLSIDVPSYRGGFPQFNVPEYGDEPWSAMRTAKGDELGGGLILVAGNADSEYRWLSRPVFVFRDPLSSVPRGATIVSETFVWDVPASYKSLWPYPCIELTDGSVSNPDEIQASDYQRAGTTVLSESSSSGWYGGSNPVELTLNPAGERHVATTGDAVVFVRFTSDVDGTSPGWSYLSRIVLGGDPEAHLHIEYLPPPR